MQCVCEIEMEGESLENCLEKIRKARKKHTCCECGGSIKLGDKYEDVKGFYLHRLATYKTCVLCKEIRECFFCSWIYTSLYEDLNTWLWQNIDHWTIDMLCGLSADAQNIMISILDDIMGEAEN
jgi:hypothetical protein